VSQPNSAYKTLPLNDQGYVDVKLLESMYMDGPDISWDQFCKRHNFNPKPSRNHCPVANWRKNKREKISSERSEELSDIFFDRRYDWNKEVAKTLAEYPKSIDQIHMLLKGRLQQWSNAYVSMAKGEPGGDKQFSRISTHDLTQMASAMAKVQTAKYKSLLLHEFTVKMADQEQEKELKNVGDKQKPFQVEIMNRGIMTNEDLEAMYDTWLDKPTKAADD